MKRLIGYSLVLLAVTLCWTLPATAGTPPVGPGDLLGSTGNVGGSLIAIDPATGTGTVRFPHGLLGPVTEIEFRSDGVLFGSTGAGASNIITIDPDTGVETLVGMHSFGAVNGLEFVDNTLYGAFLNVGGPEGIGGNIELVTVDQTNGALTSIGVMADYDSVRGLAYDPITETMYGVGSLQAGTEGALAIDTLFTLDLATASTTEIGPTGAQITGGIEFGPDGTLYGGIASGGGDTEGVFSGGDLVSIDPGTGNATAIGSTGFPALSGISFVPGGDVGTGPGVNTVEIPTLSEVGLMLMMGLLLAAGLVVLRRG